MGYFRLLYYISYIFNTIRRIFRKNKLLLIMIIFGVAIAVFICKPSEAHADWSSTDSSNLYSCRTYLSTVASRLSYTNDYLSNIGLDVDQIKTDLSSMKTYLSSIENKTDEVESLLWTCNQLLSVLNNNTVDIKNDLHDIRQALLGTPGTDEQTVTLNPTVKGDISRGYNNIWDTGSFVSAFGAHLVYYFPIQSGVSYTANIAMTCPYQYNYNICYCFANQVPAVGLQFYDTVSVSNGTAQNYSTTVNFTNNNYSYFCITFYLGSSTSMDDNTAKNYFNCNLQYTQGATPGVTGSITNIENGIDDTNDKLDSLETTINDSSINVESSLPSDTTQDVTATGIDSLFNILKNAFTSSTYSDLTLTIPFINKSITINPNNVYGGFSNNAITTLINTFWWFVISRFIILDVMSKIQSIKSGNVENVQNDNIKGDLL